MTGVQTCALPIYTAIKMILDGQCGQFNPILLKCLEELSLQFSKMLSKEMDSNKYYYTRNELLCCTGVVKERFHSEDGNMLVFRIENGFYTISDGDGIEKNM